MYKNNKVASREKIKVLSSNITIRTVGKDDELYLDCLLK